MGVDGAFWDGLFVDLVKGEELTETTKSDIENLKLKVDEQIGVLLPCCGGRFWDCVYDDEDGRGGVKMIQTSYCRGAPIVAAELLVILKTAYDMGFRLPNYCARTAYSDDFEVGCMKVGDVNGRDIQLSFFGTNSEQIMRNGKVGELVIFTFNDIDNGLKSKNFIDYCLKKQPTDVLANVDNYQ